MAGRWIGNGEMRDVVSVLIEHLRDHACMDEFEKRLDTLFHDYPEAERERLADGARSAAMGLCAWTADTTLILVASLDQAARRNVDQSAWDGAIRRRAG